MDHSLGMRAPSCVFRAAFSRAFLVFMLLIFIVLLVSPRPLSAAGYVVNTLNDDTSDDSFCTLREAILAADNTPANENCGVESNSDDTITFSVSGTITLASQLPNVASATTAGTLTIDGGETITVSGNDVVNIFYVDVGGDLTLKNIGVSHGKASFSGGGLSANDARVTILNSTFSHNLAFLGAGIISGGSDMTVVNSIFADNQAGSGGGINTVAGITPGTGTMTILNSVFVRNNAAFGAGVYNGAGRVTIANSTFSDNEASAGGGLSNAKSGTATVRSSTFSNNLAYRGGGVDNQQAGKVIIVNSTFSGNAANSTGGGVANIKHSTMSITNSTFSGNSAKSGGGGVANTNSTMTVKNTIVGNSVDSRNCNGDLAPDSTNNLATDASCGARFKVVSPSALNLGALTGMPAYFPLNPGSVAMDTGKNSVCATPPVNHQSQNVTLRPQGGSGHGITRCDIGSYEAPNPCTTLPSPPRLKDPPNKATLHTNQPLLKWKAAACAAIYFVDVIEFPNVGLADRSSKLYQLRYRTKPLATGRTYRWFVQACSNFGCATSRGRLMTLQP